MGQTVPPKREFFMGPKEFVSLCNVAWSGAEVLDRVEAYKLLKNSHGRRMLVKITIFEPTNVSDDDEDEDDECLVSTP